MKNWNKKVKKMDAWDVKLIKLSTAGFVLFLLTVWPALKDLALGVHWGWYLAASVLFAIRPIKRTCC